MKKAISLILALILCLSLAAPTLAVDTSFTDVPEDAYYAEAVLWAVENGITYGMTETEFGPDSTLTRRQLATFFWRVKGCQDPESMESPFLDVDNPNSYYYKAVLWCWENEIVVGYGDGNYGPNDPMLYKDPICIIWRDLFQTMLYGPESLEIPYAWASEEGYFDVLPPFDFFDECPRCDMVYFLWKTYAE